MTTTALTIAIRGSGSHSSKILSILETTVFQITVFFSHVIVKTGYLRLQEPILMLFLLRVPIPTYRLCG